MLNLKKIISRYVKIIASSLVFITFILVLVVEMLNEQWQAKKSAEVVFVQLEQILEENQQELHAVIGEYKNACLHNAETIAYMIEANPEILEDVEELKKIAEFVEVDEIHVFDEKGKIYAGTHPEYFGYTFDSGEQMRFFKPMLTDKTLRLCQEVTPNTADNRMMQYTAVWSEKGEYLVQVGMEPVKVMQLTKQNELAHIFANFRVNAGVSFYAVEIESGEIVGSSVLDDVGKKIEEIGPDVATIQRRGEGFHARIDGTTSYCVFKTVGSNLVGRVVANNVLYQRIPASVIEVVICIGGIAIILLYAMMWYLNRYVIGGIYSINEKLRNITDGHLDEVVDVTTSLEFGELSSHINEMVQSLLLNTKKISYVLSRTNMLMGVYEYNRNGKHVYLSEHAPKLLALSKEQIEGFSEDYKQFEKYIGTLRANAISDEDNIFQLDEEKELYLKIEEVVQNDDVFGIVIDMTQAMRKRKELEIERDRDVLTGLYNRRGLEYKLTELYKEPEKLGYRALIMVDADGLKEINDKYGHEKAIFT